jgi:hypothetical protein
MIIKTPETFFSEPVLILGRIHRYLVWADNELDSLSHEYLPAGGTGLRRQITTDFGHEVGADFLHWWIYKRTLSIVTPKTTRETPASRAQDGEQAG